MKNGKFIIVKGAFSLGIGAFIAKLLGALYRVPLTNLLGGDGLGLYQTIFPVYALLLDFSGAGVPSAISKIISSHDGDDKREYAYSYLRSSVKLLSLLGIIGSLLMAFLAKPIAKLQGNPNAYLGYLFLSPAIFLVALISCFRGYFQGLMKMSPTAKSQIVEQSVKLVLGLAFVYFLRNNLAFAVAGATFAITLSEAVALFQLYWTYKKDKKKFQLSAILTNQKFSFQAKKIIKTAVPITLIGIMIPFSHVIDSFLTVNILSTYRTDATALYGLLSGVVMTVINLPVSVCYGIATVAIPTVSSSKTESEKNRNALKTVLLTLAVSLPCALFFAYFSSFVINLLFARLPIGQKQIAIKLLSLTAPCIVLLSLLQTCNAVLIGKGKPYLPLISLSVGIVVKAVINLILLKSPNFNIYGGAIATIACYFTVCLINLIMIFKLKVKNASTRAYNREYAS